MQELWIIFNIDKMRTITQTVFNDSFWDTDTLTTNLLKTPVFPSCYEFKRRVFKARLQKEISGNDTSAAMSLLSLPLELLFAIAEQFEDYVDLICFSLTCATLWELTHPIRYRMVCAEVRAKSWAGCRIVFFGEYTTTVPNGMLTDKEIAYYKTGLSRRRGRRTGPRKRQSCPQSAFCMFPGRL
ncbi:hypothetical protein FB446DRAFT_33543 [Lentinula raphanica]|nr:hypothetical protein FB446DRAFT_33543 [Lentinula raphanica]